VREIGRVIESILNQKGKYLVLTNYHKEVPGLNLKKADDRILAAALYYHEQGKDVLLLSNDRFLRLKAEGLGIKVISSPQKLFTAIPLNPSSPISKASSSPILQAPNKVAKPKTKPQKQPTSLPVGNDAYIITTSPIHLFQNRKLGFTVEGFNEKYLNRIRAVKPGDRFVYYVAGEKIFAAITEITSRIYTDKTDLWPMEPDLKLYYRFKMAPQIVLRPDQDLTVRRLIPKLNFIQNKGNWGAYFQGSFRRISRDDYLVIEREMLAIIEK